VLQREPHHHAPDNKLQRGQAVTRRLLSCLISVAEFIDLCLGDKVDSGIGLPYRPASPCSLAGRWYDNPMPKLTLSPLSGSMNSATECFPECI
jgi:hypothetical protein